MVNYQMIILIQDGHEICFVGDEAFRELSQVDPKADELLTKVCIEQLGVNKQQCCLFVLFVLSWQLNFIAVTSQLRSDDEQSP